VSGASVSVLAPLLLYHNVSPCCVAVLLCARWHRGSQIVLDSFVPLPQAVVGKLLEVEVSSFLGLLPEINRCFITFDNVLLLWNYDSPGDFAWFRGLDQPIRTLALVVPAPGVFEDIVKASNASCEWVWVVLPSRSMLLLRGDASAMSHRSYLAAWL
jgi:hypothetical protein